MVAFSISTWYWGLTSHNRYSMNSLRASFSSDFPQQVFDEQPACVLLQFLEQPGKGAVVAVDVGLHHVLENVLHFIILALLCDSLAVPFHNEIIIRVLIPRP